MVRIISTEKLGARRTAYKIEAPDVAASIRPGQFVMARFAGSIGPLPQAVAGFERDAGTVTIVRAEAPGAAAAVIEDFSGPIGEPRPIEGGKVLCVGEGLGVAALLPRLQELKEKGSYTIVVIAFEDKDAIYWRERVDALADELYVVTADGSFGLKGPVQHTVKAICQGVPEIEQAVLIAPLDSLKASLKVTDAAGIAARVSLGAVIEHLRQDAPEDDTAEGIGLVSFDWHSAVDLDGGAISFDQLTQRLGIPLKR